ncbi:MAG TPA: HlyD family efflux transporter periplasmic adaptor subunit, partial [Tepidisphaeraceae bacterium]|nr:HlyD family efflux transporter periplasmic adaptor subunit [Tepidisphaeraceae bacterium]
VRSADVNLKAAEVALNRARQLLSGGAGTRRAVDEAQAQYDLAQKAAEAARARHEVLAAATKEGGGGSVEPLTLASPESGVLRDVQAAPGQMVAAGALLFEVINPARVWVRVPVYAGDVTAVDDERPAKVGPLSGRAGAGSAGGAAQGLEAKPVPAPPSADPRISTVDLFYELDNEKGQFNPGQRVGVTVPLRGDEESLVVPWSAVVYDATGGAWVYEKLREHAYARRRVSLRHVVNGDAVLDAGPAAGTQVVTQGVAEMFGNEMGFAK